MTRNSLAALVLALVFVGVTVTSSITDLSAANGPRVTVRDIGPQLGISYSVEGFVINRNDPRQIVLPSEGGIFKSVNGGSSWDRISPVSSEGHAERSYFVRQDPGNPSVLFMVTLPFVNSFTGPLVYRSEDFGSTWSHIDIEFPEAADIAIHQASSDAVFVLNSHSEDAMLWKSVDGGVTFEPQYDTGLPIWIWDWDVRDYIAAPVFTNIATTPADPNLVYAVLHRDAAGFYQPAIYKSVDGGQTFAPLAASPQHPLQVFPHPTDANTLFVQDFGATSDIYRSRDGGATFDRVGGLPPDKDNFFVAFDPHAPSSVYVAGEGGFFGSTDWGTAFEKLGLTPAQLGLGASTASVDPTNGKLIYVNTNRGNFKSMNGGATFVPINRGWTAGFANHIAFDRASDPRMYVAVPIGVGILRTNSQGAHYEQVPHPNGTGTLTNGRPWPSRVTVAKGDPDFIVALTRATGLFRTVDRGQSWSAAAINTGQTVFREVAIDPQHDNNVYVVTPGARAPGFYRSSDRGATFVRTYPVEGSSSSTFFTDLAIDPSNPNVIYTGAASFRADNPLLKSTDGGRSFAQIPVGRTALITDIAVDHENSNIVYLAGLFRQTTSSPSHWIVRSVDGGATFAAADTGLARGEPIGIAIAPGEASRLFAWTTDGLFMSTDRGVSWVLVEGTKTREAAGQGSSIEIHPKKSNVVYLGGATVLEVVVDQ